MKRLFVLFIPALFLLASCSEDDAGQEVTSEEASVQMNALASNATTDITTLVESEGVKGALDFLELVEDFDFTAREDQAQNVRERIKLISQYFVYGPNARVNDDDLISFEDIKGNYEWNPETQTFDESASDIFVVKFPTDGSATNNAEFQITKLELQTITELFDGFTDTYQVPTLVEASLSVDLETVISLDLTASWSDEGIPVTADVSLFVQPFTFTLGFNDSFEKTASILSSVALNDQVILGIDVDVEFTTADKEDVKLIDGEVQYYNLKISGNVDVEGVDDELGDINDAVNLELLLDNEKVADIVFENDIAYVVYLDGTKELLEEILEELFAEAEDAIEEFDQ